MLSPTPLLSNLDVELVWQNQNNWERGYTYRANPTDALVLWLMESGAVRLAMRNRNGEQWERCIGPGDAVLQPRNIERHMEVLETGTWLTIALRIRGMGALDLTALLNLPAQWRPRPECWDLLHLAALQAGAAHRARGVAAGLRCQGASRWLLGLCWDELAAADGRMPLIAPPWFEKASGAIAAKPQLPVSEAAAVAGYSPAQFRTLFRQYAGVSPREYAAQCLESRARQLLLETDWTLDRISGELGFSAATHFARFFRRQTGLSPLSFRKGTQQA